MVLPCIGCEDGQKLRDFRRWLRRFDDGARFGGGQFLNFIPFTSKYRTFYQLGADVSIDNASVVAHINSRGNFALNHLKIGNG